MRAAAESARGSLELIDGGDGGRGLAERSQLAVAAVGAAEAGEAQLTLAAAIETFRRCRLRCG